MKEVRVQTIHRLDPATFIRCSASLPRLRVTEEEQRPLKVTLGTLIFRGPSVSHAVGTGHGALAGALEEEQLFPGG